MDQTTWIRLAAPLMTCALCVAVWQWIPLAALNMHEISAWLAPHRREWYTLPMVMLAFIVLGLVPVLLLISATGIAFGPVLGPLYAMAGCLASASTSFAIGRLIGRKRVEELGGARIRRVISGLKRNGTLAVFLVQKCPRPSRSSTSSSALLPSRIVISCLAQSSGWARSSSPSLVSDIS